MSVQSVKMMSDLEDKAFKEAFEYSLDNFFSDKDDAFAWAEDNWQDFIEDKHKYLFEE